MEREWSVENTQGPNSYKLERPLFLSPNQIDLPMHRPHPSYCGNKSHQTYVPVQHQHTNPPLSPSLHPSPSVMSCAQSCVRIHRPERICQYSSLVHGLARLLITGSCIYSDEHIIHQNGNRHLPHLVLFQRDLNSMLQRGGTIVYKAVSSLPHQNHLGVDGRAGWEHVVGTG